MTEKSFLEGALEKIRATDSEATPDAFMVLEAVQAECVIGLETSASGLLHSFDVVPDQFRDGDFTLTPKASAPVEISLLADSLWIWLGGRRGPAWAKSVIAAACVEFTRSQFDSVLTGVAVATHDVPLMREWVRKEAAVAAELATTRPWHDADAIVRNPRASTWFNQSAAYDFHQWLYSTRDGGYESREPTKLIDPRPRESCFRIALALVWLDEALRDQAKSLALMALVAEAGSNFGWMDGWEAREDAMKDEGISFARKGAKARHSDNYRRKAEVVRLYKTGTYASKDAAAEEISRKLKAPFRTVRDYLKGDL